MTALKHPALKSAAWVLVALIAMLTLSFACGDDDDTPDPAVEGGDPAAGREAIERYGCGSCHSIPGVDGADGEVAVNMQGFAERDFIVGVQPNTVDNLIMFLLDPSSVVEGIAMPDLGLSEQDARDIAAHLYTLD